MDAFSSLRRFVEDLVAPSNRVLEEKVRQLGERTLEIAEGAAEARRENREFLQFMHGELAALKERIGRLEGRSDGLKSELSAILEMEILKAVHRLQAGTAREQGLLPGKVDSTSGPP